MPVKRRLFPVLLIAVLLFAACDRAAAPQPEAPPAQATRPTATAPAQENAPSPAPTTEAPAAPTPSPESPSTTPSTNPVSPLAVIGLESHDMAIPGWAERAAAVSSAWMRIDAISWAKIEPQQPAGGATPRYNWQSVDENAFIQASSHDMQVIATVKYTPTWARLYPDSVCGPVAPEHYEAFARFLGDLVARYSAAPYNVRYWELGNEPDVDDKSLSNYGCWGDASDLETYGGDDYAAMLKFAYPAIKAADPQAQVLIGGLLLDCDPSHDSACIAGRFFEGILANGGADYFDIVSYHAYPFFHIPLDPSISNRIHDLDQEKWRHRSGRGVVLGKADFLRETMAAYGVDKPLLLSESALVCADWGNGCSPSPVTEFYEKQADYVVSAYTRSSAENLLGAVWYTLEDSHWRFSGLHTGSSPTKGYLALQALAALLGPTSYYAPVNDYADQAITGLEFRSADRRIWVLWSQTELDTPIRLPEGVQQVQDKFGQVIELAGQEITVNSPVYVKLSLP